MVLITLGSKGVYVSENGKGEIVSGFRVNAEDTTAAGDTFNGAFLTALLDGKTRSMPLNLPMLLLQLA